MSNWDAIIGRMDWEGCEGCIHCDPVEGGCDVPLLEFEYGLYYDKIAEGIGCGCRETREDDEDV